MNEEKEGTYCRCCKFGTESNVFTQITCKRFPKWECVSRDHWCFEFVKKPIVTDYKERIEKSMSEETKADLKDVDKVASKRD